MTSLTKRRFRNRGAMLVAVAMIQTRRLTMSEDTGAITFYFQFTTSCAAIGLT